MMAAITLFAMFVVGDAVASPVDSLAVKAPVDSSSEKVEPVDSYFLNDRAITRIPTKLGVGALTAVGAGFLAVIVTQPFIGEGSPGSTFPEEFAPLFFGLLAGYPVGVYLADPVESSFWMTCVGYGLVSWAVFHSERDNWFEGVLFYGSPVMASELSRLLPKRYRNPNPFKWLFGKFRRPSPHVSFGLVPDPRRGLAAVATLRF